jgi:hypothetical protein
VTDRSWPWRAIDHKIIANVPTTGSNSLPERLLQSDQNRRLEIIED